MKQVGIIDLPVPVERSVILQTADGKNSVVIQRLFSGAVQAMINGTTRVSEAKAGPILREILRQVELRY